MRYSQSAEAVGVEPAITCSMPIPAFLRDRAPSDMIEALSYAIRLTASADGRLIADSCVMMPTRSMP